MDYIYEALLPKGKIYIGHTNNFKRRRWEHLHNHGSKVTRKYHPYKIKIIKRVPHRYAQLEEIKTEHRFEHIYGKNKVRGGKSEHAYNF